MKAMTVVVGVLIAGCVAVEDSSPLDVQPIDQSVRDLVPGTWGESSEVCDSHPLTIRLSADRAKLVVSSDSGVGFYPDGTMYPELTYQIIAEFPSVLRTVISNEERRTEKNEVVAWDLVMIDENRFCWHRLDWPQGGCTSVRVRCEEAP